MSWLAALGTLVVGGLVAASLAIVLPPVVQLRTRGQPGDEVARRPSPERAHWGRDRRTGGDRGGPSRRRVGSRRHRSVVRTRCPRPPGATGSRLSEYWRGGGTAPIWFLVEPRRTDLALVDPRASRLRAAYRWPFPRDYLVGGARPGDIDWYEIGPPGWFVDEGWGLTPAAAGMAHADGKGPAHAPIEAWIRRRTGPAMLMVGGRNLGGSADPLARFTVTLDDRVIDTVDVKPAPGFFLRLVPLPEGSLEGAGPYARLTVSASPADAGPRPVRAAVEQFDLQDAGEVVYGFDAGWHELEYNPATGRLWRWSSEAATVRVHSGGQDVVLRFSGESPLEDFDRAPKVSVRGGGTMLGTYQPSSAFTYDVQIAAHVLEQAGGVITLETDRTFVPDERTHNGDRRRLGLRIYSLTVRPARGFSRALTPGFLARQSSELPHGMLTRRRARASSARSSVRHGVHGGHGGGDLEASFLHRGQAGDPLDRPHREHQREQRGIRVRQAHDLETGMLDDTFQARPTVAAEFPGQY